VSGAWLLVADLAVIAGTMDAYGVYQVSASPARSAQNGLDSLSLSLSLCMRACVRAAAALVPPGLNEERKLLPESAGAYVATAPRAMTRQRRHHGCFVWVGQSVRDETCACMRASVRDVMSRCDLT